jgi:hypothetical protein
VYDTPEAAVAELTLLLASRDPQRIDQVFGPGSADMFRSGDDEADRNDISRVEEMIANGVAFDEYEDNTLVALFGEAEWPWAIPLVSEGEGWRWDTANGRDELLNRRIGRNELWTLTALHEVVDAQREYRLTGKDGLPPAYATRILSSDGKHDGLYWPPDENGLASPLGELLAQSEVTDPNGEENRPFHGYYYRLLLRRGPNAPGGEIAYTDENGLLTRGFGVIAWPAKYANSGVMTFITNRLGIVYQKDLGEETENLVQAIDSFDPGPDWTPTPDSIEAGDLE